MAEVSNIQKVVTNFMIMFKSMTPFIVADKGLLVVEAKSKGVSNQKDILHQTHSLRHLVRGHIRSAHMVVSYM